SLRFSSIPRGKKSIFTLYKGGFTMAVLHDVSLPQGKAVPVIIVGGSAGGGKSLEFVWDGRKLGIRQDGETEYEYVDLQGPQGDPGNPGEDGVGTEAQYNDIISRLEALENPEA